MLFLTGRRPLMKTAPAVAIVCLALAAPASAADYWPMQPGARMSIMTSWAER
jgi:hypothetical protein